MHTLQELFIGLDAAAALPGMLAAVERFAPDLIVRETCEFASAVAAERFGVPTVQVGIHLDTTIDTGEALLAIADPALRRLGLREPERLLHAPVLTMVPPSLSADSPRLHRFRTETPPPRERDLVYVSFGSETPHTPHFPRLYRDTIEALDGDVLVALGRDPADLGPVPGNVRVERWVDQPAALARATAMVGHGGSGSTLAALAAGVPVAFIPLFVDGHDNARRVAAAGAGRLVEGDLAAVIPRLDASAAQADRGRDRRAAARQRLGRASAARTRGWSLTQRARTGAVRSAPSSMRARMAAVRGVMAGLLAVVGSPAHDAPPAERYSGAYPAARPAWAIRSAILRLASSIISPSNTAAPEPAACASR